ncbi:single-stranded DNA-binding protein [Duganella vulcania]|uniref:Single-stranded DNA-binding protein n=1 Tax=Duganella vulcania TaxID=2692166 RepID=A0A845GCZ9_9BURK|nr:single-stranded DNA-binding protein [Duganella vulcania]MYM92493.1 single-stranded DNA-binding protein [Duganella vulcania]
MASVNRVTIVGNLGQAPSVRYMTGGEAVATISVATSYMSKDRNTGAQAEHTEWHRICFFGRLAEIVDLYLKKGSCVYVEGRLQTRKFTDKDGVEKYVTEIIGQEMQMLGHSQDAPADEPPAQPQPTPSARRPAPAPRPFVHSADEGRAVESAWDE